MRQKHGTWLVRVRVDGKQRELSLKTKSKVQAKARERQFLATLKESGLEAARQTIGTDRREKGLTIQRVIDMYSHYCEGSLNPPKETTQAQNITALSKISAALSITELKQLTSREINGYVRSLIAQDANPRTIGYRIKSASAVFKKAALIHYLDHYNEELKNPFALVNLPKSRLKQYQPLERKFREDLVKKARTELPKPQLSCFLLALHCGLRRGEVGQARKGWLRFYDDRAIITVQDELGWTPKSRESRSIPISLEVAKEILDLSGDSEFLVDHVSKAKARLESPWNSLVSWLKANGIKDRQAMHLFRKEFGAICAERFGLQVAQRYLGHSDISLTSSTYSGLIDAPIMSI